MHQTRFFFVFVLCSIFVSVASSEEPNSVGTFEIRLATVFVNHYNVTDDENTTLSDEKDLSKQIPGRVYGASQCGKATYIPNSTMSLSLKPCLFVTGGQGLLICWITEGCNSTDEPCALTSESHESYVKFETSQNISNVKQLALRVSSTTSVGDEHLTRIVYDKQLNHTKLNYGDDVTMKGIVKPSQFSKGKEILIEADVYDAENSEHIEVCITARIKVI